MKNTKNLRDGLLALALTSQLLASPTAWADIRLAKDWEKYSPSKNDEGAKLDRAALAEAQRLAATPADPEVSRIGPELGFQLYFEDRKYYIQPMLFMAKDKPDEVCNPLSSKSGQRDRC